MLGKLTSLFKLNISLVSGLEYWLSWPGIRAFSDTKVVSDIIGLLFSCRDLANWLGIEEVGLYNFKPSVRPVPLEVHIQVCYTVMYHILNYCQITFLNLMLANFLMQTLLLTFCKTFGNYDIKISYLIGFVTCYHVQFKYSKDSDLTIDKLWNVGRVILGSFTAQEWIAWISPHMQP